MKYYFDYPNDCEEAFESFLDCEDEETKMAYGRFVCQFNKGVFKGMLHLIGWYMCGLENEGKMEEYVLLYNVYSKLWKELD